ncbi:uncharacterized protein LOC111359221 [Spodoptera litura]|uniref:Uncharacterized protein LOC111359221 n=1 Tax=Spodoptera litura TaxID=69820 RepID=A0A9J7EH72_SPOLT|nr:uncharacterized protein LOC111359221 [Spodoptera litura]
MYKLKIMSCFLITIITLFTVSTQTAVNYHDYTDNMGKRDKQKMILLSEDLLKEALLQMRQLYEIKIEHRDYTPFHVGLIIGLPTANIQIGGPPDMRQQAAEEAAKLKKEAKKKRKAQKNSLRRTVKEEKAKSILRQKYLMAKLGMPPNMTTTSKRFLHQWPVEATWNLEKYNYY